MATLEEAIDLVRGKLQLNIGLKYNRPDPDLVPALVDLLRREEFLDQCVITSLDPASQQEAKRIEPGLNAGLVVHVWTVNGNVTMTRMIEAGVDNVITDRPAEMRLFLQERSKLTRGEELALQMHEDR